VRVIRPPDGLRTVGGLRFYRDSAIFYLLFTPSYPPSSLNETQPKPVTWSEVSAILKCMSEILDIPSLYKSAAYDHLFSASPQFNGKFTGPYLQKQTQYRKSYRAFETYKGPPALSQNWSTSGLKLNRSFYPPSANSAFYTSLRPNSITSSWSKT